MKTQTQVLNLSGNPIINLQRDVDTFARAYIECALWSSNDESDPSGGEPMDKNYSWTDLAPETLSKMVQDCARFQKENGEDLKAFASQDSQNGHDFWLSRNGHGTGFFDRDCESHAEEIRDRLQEAARKFGECNLYVGDDGQIYSCP